MTQPGYITSTPADAATATLTEKHLPTPGSADSCDMCPHATSEHDAISLRFCMATRSRALSRGCVCPV